MLFHRPWRREGRKEHPIHQRPFILFPFFLKKQKSLFRQWHGLFTYPLKWNTATSMALRTAYVGWLDVIGMLSAQDAHLLFRVIQVILTAPKQKWFSPQGGRSWSPDHFKSRWSFPTYKYQSLWVAGVAQQLQTTDGAKSMWSEQKSNRRRVRRTKVW